MTGAGQMIRRLQVAFIVTVIGCAPVLAVPAVQQVGQIGPTELVLHTVGSKALVRQQARVQLREGRNLLSFSWAEEKIDVASVRLQAEGLEVGETVRPAGAEQTLQWTVLVPEAGERPITIAYVVDGIDWSPDYRMSLAEGASQVTLGGEVAVTNGSGLCLGDLTARIALGRPGTGAESADRVSFPLQGLDALGVGETVRARFLPPMEMSAELVYRIDSERSRRVEKLLMVQPPTTGALGREALPAGPAYLVIDRNDRPDQIIRTKLDYEPSEEFAIGIGPERELIVERTLLEQSKSNIQFDRLGSVSGFDTVERYRLAVTSHLDREVDLEIFETVLGTWRLRTDALHVLEDGRAIMRMKVPAGGEAALEFTLTKHSGTRIP